MQFVSPVQACILHYTCVAFSLVVKPVSSCYCIVSTLSSFQCFDTVGWLTGRASVL